MHKDLRYKSTELYVLFPVLALKMLTSFPLSLLNLANITRTADFQLMYNSAILPQRRAYT